MDSKTKKKLKTSLVIEPDLWAEFKSYSALRRADPSNEMARLIKTALHGPRIHTNEELHALLDQILDLGGRHAVMIGELLELVAFSLRVGGRYSIEDLRALRQRIARPSPKTGAD